MTKVTRNGKTYYEYTPQELDERRLNNLVDERIASGYVWRQKESVFEQAHTGNSSHIKDPGGRRFRGSQYESN